MGCTDGSRMGGTAGAGVLAPLTGSFLSVPLGEHATVFQAGVIAIEICCDTLGTSDMQTQEIVCKRT